MLTNLALRATLRVRRFPRCVTLGEAVMLKWCYRRTRRDAQGTDGPMAGRSVHLAARVCRTRGALPWPGGILGVLLLVGLLALQSCSGSNDNVGETAQVVGAANWVHHWNTIALDASGLDHTPVVPGESRVLGEQFGPL